MDSEKMAAVIAWALTVDGVILFILRATGVIAWPWWVTLLPILVVVGVMVFLLNAAAVCAVAALVTRCVRDRWRADDETD